MTERSSGSASFIAAASAGTARRLFNSASARAAWRRTPASLSLSATTRASTVASRPPCAVSTAVPRGALPLACVPNRHSSRGLRKIVAAPMKIALDFSSVRKKTVTGLMNDSC
jgi:hypothetical protein